MSHEGCRWGGDGSSVADDALSSFVWVIWPCFRPLSPCSLTHFTMLSGQNLSCVSGVVRERWVIRGLVRRGWVIREIVELPSPISPCFWRHCGSFSSPLFSSSCWREEGIIIGVILLTLSSWLLQSASLPDSWDSDLLRHGSLLDSCRLPDSCGPLNSQDWDICLEKSSTFKWKHVYNWLCTY